MNTFFLPGRKWDQERLGEPWRGPEIGLAKHRHLRGLNREGTELALCCRTTRLATKGTLLQLASLEAGKLVTSLLNEFR